MEVPHGMVANESCMIVQKEGHDDDDEALDERMVTLRRILCCKQFYSTTPYDVQFRKSLAVFTQRRGSHGAILLTEANKVEYRLTGAGWPQQNETIKSP